MARGGFLAFCDATSNRYGLQRDIVGLKLLKLIDTACRAGMFVEKTLGDGQKIDLAVAIPADADIIRFYKAEVLTGLLSLLFQLGVHARNHYC